MVMLARVAPSYGRLSREYDALRELLNRSMLDRWMKAKSESAYGS